MPGPIAWKIEADFGGGTARVYRRGRVKHGVSIPNNAGVKLSVAQWMWILRPFAWLAMAVALVVPIGALPVLPDEIPRHYDLAGNVDATGGKWIILTLPMGALFLYGLLSAFQMGAPHLTHLSQHSGQKPTHPEQLRVMMQATKGLTITIFAILAVRTVSIALENPELVAPWLIWVPLGFILLVPALPLAVRLPD